MVACEISQVSRLLALGSAPLPLFQRGAEGLAMAAHAQLFPGRLPPYEAERIGLPAAGATSRVLAVG